MKNLFQKKVSRVHIIILVGLTVVVVAGLALQFAKLTEASPAVPNPGHSWSEIECDTNLCVDTGNGNVGIGTTGPEQKLHIVGTAYATGDFRAPIFYDTNSTSYYLDPASASVLNAATIYGDFTWPDAGTGNIQGKLRWPLPSDGFEMYGYERGSDLTDAIFRIWDNTSGDRFVFWFDDYRGASYDTYPLILEGANATVGGNLTVGGNFYINKDNPYIYLRGTGDVRIRAETGQFYLNPDTGTATRINTNNPGIIELSAGSGGDIYARKTIHADQNIEVAGNITVNGLYLGEARHQLVSEAACLAKVADNYGGESHSWAIRMTYGTSCSTYCSGVGASCAGLIKVYGSVSSGGNNYDWYSGSSYCGNSSVPTGWYCCCGQ